MVHTARNNSIANRRNTVIFAVALGLLLVGCSAFFISRITANVTIGSGENANYVTGENIYPRDTTELDLSASSTASLDGIEKLSKLTKLDISGLGLSDISAVASCTKLEWLDVRGNNVSVSAYDSLSAALPDCKILWDVPIGGELVSSDITSYVLTSQEPSEYHMLTYLNALESVDATQAVLCDELLDVYSLMPQCSFSWNVEICGLTVESTADFLDFNDVKVRDMEAFAQALSYLPAVTQVELCNSGLTNQQMEALCERFPEIKFVWMIHLGVWYMRTDTTDFSTANTTHQPLIPRSDLYQLKYLTDIIALDVGHQNLSDLTPLSGLTTLKALILSDCGITDISPLAGLVNLEFVELMENEIGDISVVSNWKKVERICLFKNNITDFTPLYELEKLRRVWINHNPGVKAKHDEIAANLPEGCDLCTTTRSSGQGYGWRPINYSKLGFTYSHPLNGRSPAGIEGDSYPE